MTTNGGTVTFTSSDQLYIIPLYQSGYTLDSITANNGTVTSDTENGYGYYYYTPSANSNNTVTLNGIPLTSDTTNTTLTTMQDLATTSCPSIPTAVRDGRDNAVYYVQRMIDGKCWMLENLRLDLTDESVISGLSTSNTHVDSGSLNSLVNGGGTTTDHYATAGLTKSQWTSGSSYSAPLVNSNYKTNTVTGYGPGRNYIGVYYNYCAASAGSYCINSSGDDMGTAEYDICPANWQMPTGGSAGQYQALATAFTGTTGNFSGTNATAFRYYPSTPLSGNLNNGTANNQGSCGVFWSATRYSASYMYGLYVDSSLVYPQVSNSRGNGYSVRCVRQ